MKRAEMLRALQGCNGQLQELHCQQRNNAIPYRETHGIIDATQRPIELLDLTLMYGEIDDKLHKNTLREWVILRSEVSQIKRYGRDGYKTNSFFQTGLNLIRQGLSNMKLCFVQLWQDRIVAFCR